MRGFSLIELSIVLVILGLLTGGILAGQSLIRASELRSAGVQLQQYFTATMAFRDKYFAYPGDIANATSFWGKNSIACNSHAGTAATDGTCNGNGDGRIATPTGGASLAGTTQEGFQFWNHLGKAGLIAGNYTGISGNTGSQKIIGTNSPQIKLSPAAAIELVNFGVHAGTNTAGGSNLYAMDYGLNAFALGTLASTASGSPNESLFRPEEIWALDVKMDDGRPAYGKIILRKWDVCSTSTSQTDLTGDYLLSNNQIACALIWRGLL